jgi:hypothetical protein
LVGESQHGQMCLSIGLDRGRCPPVQIWAWCFTHRSQVVPIGWTWAALCQPTRGLGRDGNFLAGTKTKKLEDVGSPRWGPRWCQLLAILCVTLSLAMFALAGADLASGFCLRILSLGRPTPIMGPVLDMVVVSYVVVAGEKCEESGRSVNMGLLCPLLRLVRAYCFASSVVTPWGYKSK